VASKASLLWSCQQNAGKQQHPRLGNIILYLTLLSSIKVAIEGMQKYSIILRTFW
jgi:hypothetical protein